MKYRFYNAKILVMEQGCSIIEGEVWIDGSKIIYVGAEKESDICWDEEIDAEGNLLMPGFKNAHTHSGMTFLRSMADDLPLHEWLENRVFPLEARLTPEHVYHLSKLAIMEYLTSGITSNFDMYFFPEAIARASEECGFRTVLVSGATSFGGNTAKEMEENYLRFNERPDLIRYCLGFHAEYTSETPLLQDIAALAQKLKAPVYNHNSETEESVEMCIKRTGMTPTVFLDSLGMFEYGGGGYHCVHMSEEDLRIFREKNLTAVINAGSNLKLASGVAPVHKMLGMGINLAIGTDGPASNNCLDMFREMFLVIGLAKVKGKDASVVKAEDVLTMAVKNGARAMGIPDCDMLAEGKRADMIMIDLQQPNMQPLNQLAKNIVYSGSKSNIKMTMINGKILYENGRFHIGVSPKEVYENANRIVQELI